MGKAVSNEKINYPYCTSPTVKKTLKERLIQARLDCNCAEKRLAQDKLYEYLGYNCLLSRHGTTSEESVRRKAKQINEANKSFIEKTRETL